MDTIKIIRDTSVIAQKAIGNNEMHFIIQTPDDGLSQLLTNGLTILLALIAAGIALYQVKLNIISSARINWIENLRKTISDYLSEADFIVSILKNIEAEAKEIGMDAALNEWYPKYHDSIKNYNVFSYNVKLNLNSSEANHKKIEEHIEAISKILGSNITAFKKDEIQGHINEIIALSKNIFKQEWEKSKRIFRM